MNSANADRLPVGCFDRSYARAGLPLASDPECSGFRRRQVTVLVRQVYLRAWEIDPRVKVSAALIAWRGTVLRT